MYSVHNTFINVFYKYSHIPEVNIIHTVLDYIIAGAEALDTLK